MAYPQNNAEAALMGIVSGIASVGLALGIAAGVEPTYKAIYKDDLVNLKKDFTQAAVTAAATCTSTSIFSDPQTIKESVYSGLLSYTSKDGWALFSSWQASVPEMQGLMADIKSRDITFAGPPSIYNRGPLRGQDTRVIAVYYNGSQDGHDAKTLLVEDFEDFSNKEKSLLKSITDNVFSKTLTPGDVVVFARRLDNDPQRLTYTLKNGELEIPTINPEIYGTVRVPPNPCHKP